MEKKKQVHIYTSTMKKLKISLIIIVTAFTNIQAQHPRVCDYVSLKHALKGLECEVMKPGPYYNGDTVVVEHSKEEIRIGVINKYGKAIDSLNIINYKNDTVYIYSEYDIRGKHITEIKTHKGAFRIRTQTNPELFFEPLEMPDIDKQELNDAIPESIYPDIFEWDGLEKLIKDSSTKHTADVWCTLTRLILNEYKLMHVDRWESRIFMGSLKRNIALCKKYGRKIDLPSEFEVIHVYDTISKKNNDEYISIMYEDENTPLQWVKKGSEAIILINDEDSINKEKYYLYKEPDTKSKKIYKVKELDALIIYDTVGLWYYVKVIDKKGKEHNGWVKLKKEPGCFYNAEFYK